MLIATLIARPGALDETPLARLATDWGAAEVAGAGWQWLSPGEAAEIALTSSPADFEERRQALSAAGIDLCLQPAAGRRKALLVADMDSTVIEQECIDEMADLAGVGAEVQAITKRAMNGEIDFAASARARVALFAGRDAGIIRRTLDERITLAPGARQLVATMRAHGARTALVSGGFTVCSGPIAARLGFDEHHANELLIEGERITGKLAEPILDREAKATILRRLAAPLPGGMAATMAVGDGANDLAMLRLAGAGVALHAKPAVAAEARLRIDHGDLTALLFLQGYHRREFAL